MRKREEKPERPAYLSLLHRRPASQGVVDRECAPLLRRRSPDVFEHRCQVGRILFAKRIEEKAREQAMFTGMSLWRKSHRRDWPK